MIILRIRARDVNTLIQQYGYDSIRVYRDISPTGSFATQIGTVSPLVAGQEYYEFVDGNGLPSNYYEFSYHRSSDNTDSSKTEPFIGSITQGPLGLLTIGYVWATTELVDLQNAPGSTVGEFILRAESILQLYGNRYGGFLTTAAGWAQTMPIAARMLLEDLWLMSRPANRNRVVSGLTSEKRGSYSYSAAPPKRIQDWKELFTEELKLMLRPFLAGDYYKISSKTTQVFVDLTPTWTPLTPNQDPNLPVRLWNDYLDIDFMPNTGKDNLALGPGNLPLGNIHRWSD